MPGIFPTTSDTTPVPVFNCSSITLLCLACSAFDLDAETVADIPPVTPPAALQELQQLMESMLKEEEILQFFLDAFDNLVEIQTYLTELHF